MDSKFLNLRKEYINLQFEHLNEMQKKAVFTINGPLLILAGAGSGKTSVLINRISNMVRFGDSYNSSFIPKNINDETIALLENAIKTKERLPFETEKAIAGNVIMPYNILAITFTNKAAGELKERLTASLDTNSYDVTASTFHSLCVRILRRNAHLLNFGDAFTIYDSDDQKRIVKEILKENNIDDKFLNPKVVISRMSSYKDKLISPKEAENFANNTHEKLVVKCYEEYQRRLFNSSAFDFDDLIYYTVKLLQENEEVRKYYQLRYKYIMVDEYQDTSIAQFELIKNLSSGFGNICVVGDDDQSIYRFRGATIENILSFEEQFDNALVIKLEENYRSTKNILDAANSVIKNNKSRKGKTLWTKKTDGKKVSIYSLEEEREEGQNIVSVIAENIKKGIPLKDHAVLYRMNMQSSNIERALASSGIAYRIIGGYRFYDRKEIKDLTAYLNIFSNPNDDLRLKRIINVPARKIGATTVNTIQDIAVANNISMLEVIKNIDNYPAIARAKAPLMAFMKIYDKLYDIYINQSLEDFLPNLINITGYEDMLVKLGEEGKTALENVGQLVSNINLFVQENEEASLMQFLEEVSLISDMDNYDKDSDAVTLMTMHSSKGLEFPYVFLVGVEEGIFPGEQSKYNEQDLEEERRLCYVAFTRAKSELYIFHCAQRMVFGQTKRPVRSRFLEEIDEEVIDLIDKRQTKKAINPLQMSSFATKPLSLNNMSANSSLNTQNTNKNKNIDLNVNDKVRHKVFGEGIILKITPLAGDAMLEVNFGPKGVKKIMANYTPLEKL